MSYITSLNSDSSICPMKVMPLFQPVVLEQSVCVTFCICNLMQRTFGDARIYTRESSVSTLRCKVYQTLGILGPQPLPFTKNNQRLPSQH